MAWSEVVNLPTQDPDRAWRMMAHTAMCQFALKAAAGVKATGRKLTKPVLAYSLSWHPDEKPTRAEQTEAARATLSALGLGEHQALIVAHDDTPHAHVHVLVNRVHPVNGIAATLSNSKRKLSEWAQAYEEGRGRIFCETRVENNARRQRSEPASEPRTARNQFEAARARSNDNLAYEFTRTEQQQKDAHLHAIGRTIEQSHARQWVALETAYASMRDRQAAAISKMIAAKLAALRADHDTRWKILFDRQQIERDKFFTAEEGTLSKFFNIASAYRTMRRTFATASRLQILRSALSPQERAAIIGGPQLRERKAFAKALTAEVRAVHGVVQSNADRTDHQMRADYLHQCDKLRTTQGHEVADHRRAWTVRNAERRAALAPHQADQPDHRRSHRPTRPQRVPDQGQANAKASKLTPDPS